MGSVHAANRAVYTADRLSYLIELDGLLDSGHSRAFQGSLLACNAAEAGQPCIASIVNTQGCGRTGTA